MSAKSVCFGLDHENPWEEKLDREFYIFERGRGNTRPEMEMEENDDDGARDGETAGEADAPAAASTAAPALPIAAAAAPTNVTGKRVLNARESLMPSKDTCIHTATVGTLLKCTCVPTASVGTLLQEVQVDKERVRGA